MKRSIALLASVAMLGSTLGSVAVAQGVPQTLSLMKTDKSMGKDHSMGTDKSMGDEYSGEYSESGPTTAVGYRTSKVVGSTVYNQEDETVGTIDDLIVTTDDTVPYAVLSVGGFLGMGERHVVVPYADLEVQEDRMVYRDATKDSIKALPEFKYQERE